MSQQFIDFGTFPNDPSADPIRAAFQKIQDNFNELYSTTLVSGVSNVYVGPGLAQNDNSGNIFITANIPYIKMQTANGLTVDQGSYSPTSNTANVSAAATPFVVGLSNAISANNANFSGNVRIGSLIATNVGSGLTPNANVSYDLGTPSSRWRDLYLSGSTLALGPQTISANSAGVIISNLIVSTNISVGNVTLTGTLTTANISASGVAAVTGTATVGNLTTGGNIDATGLLSVGSNASVGGKLTVTANANVTGNVNVTGNIRSSATIYGEISAGNIAASGDITGTGNITIGGTATITGNISGANLRAVGAANITGNANVGAHLTVVANATVGGLSVTSYVNTDLLPYGNETQDLGSPTHRWRDLFLSGNSLKLGTSTITSTGDGGIAIDSATITGNLDVGNVTATYVQGTLTSSSQPNITSVGILSNLSVSGDLSTGNISVVGDLTAATMNVTGSFSATTITGNVVVPPGGVVAAPGNTTQLLFNDDGNTAAVAGMTFDKVSNLLTITGNVSGGNIVTSGAVAAGTGDITTLNSTTITASGNVTGANLITAGILSASGNVSGGNLSTSGFLQVTGNASMGNITAVNSITGNVVSIAGNISGANLVASGILKVDGNANVGNLTTNEVISVSVTSSGNVSGGNLTTGGLISATGTVTGGNLVTSGVLTATGNITGGNITTGGVLNVTGNGTFGNVSGGTFTATLFSGNGSSITGLNILNASTVVAVTSVAGTGSVATLGFSTRTFAPYSIGQSITIAGVTPTGYNVTATVITCSASTVTFSCTATGSTGFVSGVGTITGGAKASAALQSDTVISSSQPNITSVGTLTGLTLSGGFTGTDVTSTGFFLASVGTGVSAAGTNQAGATLLTKQVNVISTVATGINDGIKLPAPTIGMQLIIVNTTAFPVKIYPSTGGNIDSLATNGSFSLGAGARLMIVAATVTQWYTMVGVYG
jgi:hypothetical protein